MNHRTDIANELLEGVREILAHLGIENISGEWSRSTNDQYDVFLIHLDESIPLLPEMEEEISVYFDCAEFWLDFVNEDNIVETQQIVARKLVEEFARKRDNFMWSFCNEPEKVGYRMEGNQYQVIE